MPKKIIIPGRLHAGTTEQIVTGANEVYDDKRNKSQSEVNDDIYATIDKVDNKALHHADITDSLNSSSTFSPLSANQGKVLKGLIDAKVIASGSVPMDSEPTEGNTANIVTSDGVYKAIRDRQYKRNTLANWTSSNPILKEGEVVLVATDVANPTIYNAKKVGDGVHGFNELELIGEGCLQELGDSTQFPVSQKVVSKNIDYALKNSLLVSRGYYYNKLGILTKYDPSITSYFLLPTKPCKFYGLWNYPKLEGVGIVFLNEDFEFIGNLDVGVTGENSVFEYNPTQISVPEGAKYIATHTQWSTFKVESQEPLTCIPISIQKDILKNRRDIFTLNNEVRNYFVTNRRIDKSIKELYIYGDIPNSILPLSIMLFNNNKTSKGISLKRADSENIIFSENLVDGYNKIKLNSIFIEIIVDFTDISVWNNDLYTEVLPNAFDINYSPTIKEKTYFDNILTTITEKNRFNKKKVIKGNYIDTNSGLLVSDANSAVSPLIPITPEKTYYISRPNIPDEPSLSNGEVRFLDDKENPLKSLNVNGTERGSFWFPINGAAKAPKGAVYLQFTVAFKGTKCDYDKVQVEEGLEPTSYVPYEEYNIVDYPILPKDLNGLSDKVIELENRISDKKERIDIINIQNSDKIGFFSNSFLNGYCMLGKHAINNLSMYSDYIMYNYGHSGDDLLELLARIERNEKWLGDVPVQEWGIKYGVIAMQSNDWALYAASSDTYYENGKKLVNAIKAMGGIPILSTEHNWLRFYYNFVRLAQEQNIMLMNWGATADKLKCDIFPPFWLNSHPATRTAWLWSYGMQNYFNTLPRPEKAIKLFRVRPSVDTSNLANLMYEDILSRAERFEEIGCGVDALNSEYEKYFDRLDVSTPSKFSSFKDEYQKLQSKSSAVDFSNYCLVELITPYDINRIKSATLKINATGVTSAFVKKIISLSNPLPSTRYVAFGIETGTLNIGQSFEITGGVFNDNIRGTYTVMGIVNNMVVTTTSSIGKTTSGTDNPITNIEDVVLRGSYDYPSPDYMQRYNKPLGEWVEVAISENGEIVLDDYLSTSMDFDKLSVLLVGENISLSDVSGIVIGTSKKENSNKKLPLFPKKGISLLTDTLFIDESSWQGIENLEIYNPVKANSSEQTEQLPKGINTVRIMSKGQSIQQRLNTTNIETAGYGFSSLQIRIVARYFPEYVNSDTKWETSVIKRGTYDCAKLAVKLSFVSDNDSNPVKAAVIHVGAWWNEFIIETPYYDSYSLILEAEDSNIQIAKCEVVQII